MSETAYTPADGTSLAHWTFKSPPNRANWQPDLSIGNTIDATTAPAYLATSPNDTRSEPGIVTAVRTQLGYVPANTSQGFLAWTDTIEASTLTPMTTGTSDPAGGDDSLESDAPRWVELTYDMSTDLICPLLEASFGTGVGGLLLRYATVVAHWTFEGGGTGWLRNATP